MDKFKRVNASLQPYILRIVIQGFIEQLHIGQSDADLVFSLLGLGRVRGCSELREKIFCYLLRSRAGMSDCSISKFFLRQISY